VHMLSQLTKTIKLALKSTNEERAILRARSAVQRFPVVEWRQRLEDFQRRSIAMSRAVAGDQAWGYDIAGGYASSGFYAQGENGSNTSLARAEWARSGTPDSSAPPSPMPESRRLSNSPMASPLAVPEGQGANGYFEHNNQLSAGPGYHNRFGGKDKKNLNRQSAESFYDEDPNASPLYYEDKRRSAAGQPGKPRFFADDEDAPSSRGSSDHGDTTVVGSSHSRDPTAAQSYDHFLAAANRQFAKQSGGRNAPDPYFESNRQSVDGGAGGASGAPSRPFTTHSRVSSFDSISSIVDEKGASPLNKAMETVSGLLCIGGRADGDSSPTRTERLRSLSCKS
jgi:alpha-1,3-glucan synthase